MIPGAVRLTEEEAAKWQGDPAETPKYMPFFERAADVRIARSRTDGALRGFGYTVLLFAWVLVSWLCAVPHVTATYAAAGVTLLGALRLAHALVTWFRAIKAEKALLSDIERKVRDLGEPAPAE